MPSVGGEPAHTFPELAGAAALKFEDFADEFREEFGVIIQDKHLAMLVIAAIEAREPRRAPRERRPKQVNGEPVDPTGFVGRLRRARELRGISAEALSRAAGMSESYVWQLESYGLYRRPRRCTVEALARALGVPPSELEPSFFPEEKL